MTGRVEINKDIMLPWSCPKCRLRLVGNIVALDAVVVSCACKSLRIDAEDMKRTITQSVPLLFPLKLLDGAFGEVFMDITDHRDRN